MLRAATTPLRINHDASSSVVALREIVNFTDELTRINQSLLYILWKFHQATRVYLLGSNQIPGESPVRGIAIRLEQLEASASASSMMSDVRNVTLIVQSR